MISCGKEAKKSSRIQQNVSPLFNSQVLTVKVFYEEDAQPYTDNILTVKIWDLLQINLDALFKGRTKRPQVIIPKTLPEMTKTISFHRDLWTVEDVLNISKTYPEVKKTGTETFKIFFVKGYSKESPTIIGFHINDSNIMVIFKDVIKNSGNGNHISKYLEQATLVHEMGHALGLVNNGLPMVTPHHDQAHGAHCLRQDCVMYYSNEGASSMMSFAKDALAKGSLVMFEEQCLSDARNYKN
jgi:predicted Zn-dependent protease